jgi:hypothetical protein
LLRQMVFDIHSTDAQPASKRAKSVHRAMSERIVGARNAVPPAPGDPHSVRPTYVRMRFRFRFFLYSISCVT